MHQQKCQARCIAPLFLCDSYDNQVQFHKVRSEQSEVFDNLVEDILVIPRLEAGRLPLSADEFDLRDLTFEIDD